MALSVAVQKNLADYEPKLIGKLTLRTLISIASGLGMALLMGTYLNFVICVPIDDFGFLIILAALPGYAIGFWKPDTMRPEEWLPLWFKHALTADVITYTKVFDESEADKDTKALGKEIRFVLNEEKSIVRKLRGRGTELLSPTNYL